MTALITLLFLAHFHLIGLAILICVVAAPLTIMVALVAGCFKAGFTWFNGSKKGPVRLNAREQAYAESMQKGGRFWNRLVNGAYHR